MKEKSDILIDNALLVYMLERQHINEGVKNI